MNIPSSRRTRGFTLVELLVVISIIAVLAAAGFTVGTKAIERARTVTALATCTALESAVNSFFTEYGSLPTEQTEDLPVARTDTDLALLEVLLGTDTTLNTRGVKFLSVKDGKSNRNGLIYNAAGNKLKGLYDPWGGPYNVMMDGDYDEKLTVQPKGSSRPKTLNGRRVAAWSDGKDGVNGTGKVTDDVVTW